jgi:hypothetical protein
MFRAGFDTRLNNLGNEVHDLPQIVYWNHTSQCVSDSQMDFMIYPNNVLSYYLLQIVIIFRWWKILVMR